MASVLFLACGGTTPVGPGDGGGDGSGGDGSGGDGSGGDGSNGNDGGDGGLLGDCKAPPINLTFGTNQSPCPMRPMCGGTIADGTYWYTSGCIADPWAQAKMACQALEVHNQMGTVKGCVTFAGGIVTRAVMSSYSAMLHVPTSCLLGGTCMQLESVLKMSIPMVSCAAATGGCDCNVSSGYTGTGGATYTTTNNQIVTSANNHYDYCVNGGTLATAWASGPDREPGVYDLTKQ